MIYLFPFGGVMLKTNVSPENWWLVQMKFILHDPFLQGTNSLIFGGVFVFVCFCMCQDESDSIYKWIDTCIIWNVIVTSPRGRPRWFPFFFPFKLLFKALGLCLSFLQLIRSVPKSRGLEATCVTITSRTSCATSRRCHSLIQFVTFFNP